MSDSIVAAEELPSYLAPWNGSVLKSAWPASVGRIPTEEEVKLALKLGATAGKKFALAWVMYCREVGATREEIVAATGGPQFVVATNAANAGKLEFRRVKHQGGGSTYFMGPIGSQPGGPNAVPVGRQSTPNQALSRDELEDAMADFDAEERASDEWKSWENNRAHRYAIQHKGRHYPVKHIVAKASGIPVNKFSGGESGANEVVRRAGLEIIQLNHAVSALTVAEAEDVLSQRLTRPKPATQKIATFTAENGRSIALDRESNEVRIWVRPPIPQMNGVSVRRVYSPTDSRSSNLPRELNVGSEVYLLDVSTFDGLNNLVDELISRLALNRMALEGLKRVFLAKFSDFAALTFDTEAGGYWNTERQYKNTIIARAAKVFSSSPSDMQLGEQLIGALMEQPSNLIEWRSQARLDQIRKVQPGVIEEALGRLARSAEREEAAVAEFVEKIWPVFAAGNDGNLPYADIRTLPTMALALVKPSAAIGIRYQPFFNLGEVLLGRALFANAPLTEAEYANVLSIAREIFAIMTNEWGWKPRDLWDVQGFIWTTCNKKPDLEAGTSSEGESATVDAIRAIGPSNQPTNLILYGPPGTGKTYTSAEEAVRLCLGDDAVEHLANRHALMRQYDELVAAGRIEFVTFHQSFSYEEFVEGLRPETNSNGDGVDGTTTGFRLVARPGVFKAIADRASANHGSAPDVDYQNRKVFKMSLGRANDDEDAYLFKEGIENGYIHLGYGGGIDWSDSKYEEFDAVKQRWQEHEHKEVGGNDGNVQQVYALRSSVCVGDLVIVSDGNKRFRAIGEVSGPYQFVSRDQDTYCQRRPVKWLWVDREGLPREEIYDKGFSQVSIYQLDPDFIKWPALKQIISGGGSGEARGAPEPYVIIIDEINRANISKVFGELITLLEPDKRIGQANEIRVRLPYSGKSFGVPANLHIIGTMNTADRSIALLDTALRRRFAFRELMPDISILSTNVEGIDLQRLLRTVNERIEYLYDREHQIGHAYFTGCRTKKDIEEVLRDKVIPLLSEYFYEDRAKVAQALGDFAGEGIGAFDGNFFARAPLTLPGGAGEEAMVRYRWTVQDSFDLSEFEANDPTLNS